MLKTLFVLIIVNANVAVLIAQDLVVTNTLDSIECRIIKITGDTFHISFIDDEVEKNTTILRAHISYFAVDYKNVQAEPRPPVKSLPYPKFRIGIGGGIAQLIGGVPNNIPQQYLPYVEELKSGDYANVEVCFYENEKIGVGFTYSFFRTSNQLKDVSLVDSTGTTIYGLLEDDITVNYLGPTLAIRRKLTQGSAYFVANLSVGMLSYVNDATVINKIKISGKTLGYSGNIGLDFQITGGLYFGIGAGVTFGVLKELKVETGGNVTGLNLSDLEYLNASRVDLGLGLRYFI